MHGCYRTHGHVTVGFPVPPLCLFFSPLPPLLCLWFAVNIGLINQAAWQVNVRNGWVSVWRGGRTGSVQVHVCVCVEGKGEPAVAQLRVAHGSVSKDNCRYQPAPLSLMWTWGIMEAALSQWRGNRKERGRIGGVWKEDPVNLLYLRLCSQDPSLIFLLKSSGKYSLQEPFFMSTH